ncbi:MAG: hypothetical protein ACD_38C00206G0006 [uncultured bacterium]|nr:MAG: hypothetical protein ACD_38C00206G0006 [uncultured bacterium]KKQ82919.1 MAG: hypothetical protein UT04_C0043G0008 [Candidatus Daviesbacteria bacterium GW2011_GWF2_38_7]KKR15565.1 MAG: hypothetical protein UT45_C0018G0005 [Candidatus Daviesbacteria bacterium GW2011_GWA2_39_33]KKR24147.1 MAG: hypothetical protein UT54_C0028G0005 [Candidatus Daviesbacteria bacterium GW2011_GWB1_39_5]OGE22128.1 MAG: hypothetical protein A2778_01255 [Candidatus Daviesbacteria bacterium RIFCSPHIGHO2_01_FULL_4
MAGYKILTDVRIKEFIDSLDSGRKARIDRVYSLFERYGRFLPGKYLKKLTSDVWELRPGDIRLFLGMKGNTAYIVHGIYKKTKKTPKKDLDLAVKRFKEI